MSTEQVAAPQVLDADTIITRNFVVVCPHCSEEQGGWVADPRNGEYDCDDCGKPYRVVDKPDVLIFPC